MKWRDIRDLDHHGNRLFRRPKRVAWGHIIQFPRWSKSHIPRLFHRIRYLYYTSLSVCFSATVKYCSSVLEGYRSRQDCRYWRPAHILVKNARHLNDNACDCSFTLLLFCHTCSLPLSFVLLKAHKLLMEKFKQPSCDYTCVNCSASSGRHHFDDVIKHTGRNWAIWLVRNIELWYNGV